MTDSISTKICRKCQVEKPLSEFHKRKRNKDGHRYACKECILSYHKEYNHKNAELISDKNKIYYRLNSDHIKKKTSDYYNANTERCKAKKKEHYNKNIERISACAKAYRETHIEEKKIQDRIYRENHSKEIKAKKKEYYEANSVEINLKGKINREKNIEKCKRREQKYRNKNVGRMSKYNHDYRKTERGIFLRKKSQSKRRAAKRNATIEDFSPVEVFERDNYKCQTCGVKTRPDYKSPFHPLYPNLDHIIPLSRGGDHSKINTQTLCRKCNATKHNSEKFGDQLRLFG